MAKKHSDYPIPPLNFDSNWGQNAQDGYPQSGQQVNQFINDSFRSVARAVFFDPATYTLLFFKSDEDKQAYKENPEAHADLVVFSEPMSFTGMIRRANITNHSVSTRINATTNMENVPISFSYRLEEKSISETEWTPREESATIIISVDNGNGYHEVARETNVQRDALKEFNVRPYIVEGTNQIRVTAEANDSENTKGNLVYSVLLTEMYVENFENQSFWYRAIVEGISSASAYQLGGFRIVGDLSKTLHFDIYDVNDKTTLIRTLSKVIGNRSYQTNPYFFDQNEGLNLNFLETGSYIAKVYLSSGELSTRDNAVEYPFMYIRQEDALTAQVVTIANVANTIFNGDTNTLCDFAAYNAGLSEASPLRSVQQYIGYEPFEDPITFEGTVETEQPQHLICYINIEDESTELGYLTTEIEVSLGESSCTATNIVDNSQSHPAESGYDFLMNPSLRQNGELHPEYVINAADGQACTEVEWTKMAFIDGIDGWTTDDEDRPCLKIPAGSKMSLPYSFFKFLNNSNLGKNTVEICYKIDNVSDFDENCITIATNPTTEGFTGIRIRPNNVMAHSSTDTSAANDSNRGTNLNEGQVVDLMISIEPEYYPGKNLLTGYIDGCKNFQFEFSGIWNLNANLEIGSSSSDIYVYAIRHYARPLRASSAEKNFVSTILDKTSKIAEFDKIESVIDSSSHKVSFEKVKDNGYNYFVVEMKNGAEIPSKKNGWAKDTLGQSTLEMHFGNHPSWDFRVEDVETGGQGTTSMNYWLWNLRFRLDKWPDGIPVPAEYQDESGKYNKKRPVAYRDSDGEWMEAVDSKTLNFDGEGQHPALKRITAKINFASSMQSHKMGATYAYTLLHDSIDNGAILNEAQVAAQQAGAPVPTVAVYEYPAFGFSKVGDTYEFIGMFTIGPDKGDKPTFGYDKEDFENSLITLEGTDHTPRLALFNHPWDSDVEYRATNECLNIVKGSTDQDLEGAWEVSNAGAYSTDKEADQSDINDMLEDEFKPAYDNVYGNSTLIFPVALDDPTWGGATAADVLANINADILSPSGTFLSSHYQGIRFPNSAMEFWIEGEHVLYHYSPKTRQFVAGTNLVTQCGAPTGDTLDAKNEYFKTFRRNAFKSVAADYWDLDDSIFCMCFLLMFGATDNFAKNSYPYKFKSLASGGRWRWRQDDLDTIFDIDNNGGQTKPYWIEYTDTSANGEIYFAGSASVFWNLIFECYFEDYTEGGSTKKGIRSYGAAIMTLMRSLTSQSRIFDGAMEFVKRYFWDKAQFYFPVSGYNEDASLLYEDAWRNQTSPSVPPLAQSLGNHYLAEYRWVKLRMIYLMSLFRVGPFDSYEDASLGLISFRPISVPALTVKPGIWLYPTVLSGQGGNLGTSRVEAGQPKTFTGISGDGNTYYYIQAADYLTDLGDLSKLLLGYQDAGRLVIAAKRLKKLKIGDEDPEEVLTNITTLVLTDAPSLEEIDARNTDLSGEMDLTNCPRIKKVYAEGSTISAVMLEDGSKIEILHLPASISSLVLKKTKFLSDLVVASWANIVTLGLIDSDGVSATDALTNAFNADNSPLANISLKWNNIASVENDFVTALANIALGKTKSGAAQSYDASIQGTFKLDEPHYQADFEALEFQEVTPSHMEGYKEGVSTKFNKPLRAFYLNKLYIPFADEVVLNTVKSVWGDGIGVPDDATSVPTSIPTLPNSITEFSELNMFVNIKIIPANKFSGFSNLRSFGFNNITEIAGQGAFTRTTSLNIDVVAPELLRITSYGQNLASRDGAFDSSAIKSFVAPKCTLIGGNTVAAESCGAFRGCTQLTYVKLDKVTEVVKLAFYGCTSLSTFIAPLLASIGDGAFYGCPLTDFDFSNVKTIGGHNTFKDTSLNIDVVAPELLTITSYGVNLDDNTGAFANTAIKSFVAPKCTLIGGNRVTKTLCGAFRNCTNLTLVSLENITTIDKNSFTGCSSLETFIVNNVTPPSLGEQAFSGTSSSLVIYVPDTAVDTYKAATGWTTYASRIHPMSELPE